MSCIECVPGCFGSTTCTNYCFKHFKHSIQDVIDDVKLSQDKKKVIMKRVVKEIVKSEWVSTFICFLYYILRFSSAIGSVLLTSLLLLSKLSFISETTSQVLFWLSWSFSLIVGASNEIMYTFGIDKKFYINTLILEKLKSEVWQYIELSGKYKKYNSHESAYKNFVHRIEKLKIVNVIHNLELSEHDTQHNQQPEITKELSKGDSLILESP